MNVLFLPSRAVYDLRRLKERVTLKRLKSLRYQVTDLISHDIMVTWAEFGYGKYLILPFLGTLRRHIRLVWFRHGYFGETQLSQKPSHGSTKLALGPVCKEGG